MKPFLVIAMLLALTACTTTVYMRNPQTGATVTCGPYPTGGLAGINTAALSAQCINDYKEQGFIRVPDPR